MERGRGAPAAKRVDTSPASARLARSTTIGAGDGEPHMSVKAERPLRSLADKRVVDLAKANRRGPKRGARAEGAAKSNMEHVAEPSRLPRPRPAINADAQPKTSRNLPRTLKEARSECRAWRIRRPRPRGRRIADHRIATSTSIEMGKPGFEPRSGDGRPCVIDLVERRENGIGEFGALSSNAGEEDDGFFVALRPTLQSRVAKVFRSNSVKRRAPPRSHRPQSARDGGCCLAIEIGKQFDQRRQIRRPGGRKRKPPRVPTDPHVAEAVARRQGSWRQAATPR